MSQQNTELVQALERLLKDSEFVIQQLANDQKVDKNTYKQISFNTDTTSGCVIEGLFELREYLEDAIDQYDVA